MTDTPALTKHLIDGHALPFPLGRGGAVAVYLAADVDALLSASPRPAGGWQPIETFDGLAIQFGTGVIVCEDGIVGEATWRGEDEGWWWANNAPSDVWGSRIYPQHWMPMPAPPTKEEQ